MDEIFRLDLADEVEIAVRLGLAVVLGGLIGFERRQADKPAGVRTMSLVALGAALFTIISIFGFDTGDKGRVAAQIVTGVGFLGAGLIFRGGIDRADVRGLTTAASLWATAAVGMAIGAGLYIVGAVATALALALLYFFPRVR